MSPRGSKPSKPSADAAPDIYVGLLLVSVAALAIACVFLSLELAEYNWTLAG